MWASAGYTSRNVVRDPDIGRHAKGRSGLLDALLLAHCDFFLKGTSSLSEFALWYSLGRSHLASPQQQLLPCRYSPPLIERHLDLQMTPRATQSGAYRTFIPRWAGGPYCPPPFELHESPLERLHALHPGGSSAPITPRLTKWGGVGGSGGGDGPWSWGSRSRRHVRRRGVGGDDGSGGAGQRVDQTRGGASLSSPALVLELFMGQSTDLSAWPEVVARKAQARTDKARAAALGRKKVVLQNGPDSTCASVGLRPLTEGECRTYQSDHAYRWQGVAREVTEPTGCTLWDPDIVEFNPAGSTAAHCGMTGGSCVCFEV